MITNIASTYSQYGATFVGFFTADQRTNYVTFSLADGTDPQDHQLGLTGLHEFCRAANVPIEG